MELTSLLTGANGSVPPGGAEESHIEEDSPQSKTGFQLPSSAMGESLELSSLSLVQIPFQETQVEGPAAGQVPTGAIRPSHEPTQPPGKPVPVPVCSLIVTCQLGAWARPPGQH